MRQSVIFKPEWCELVFAQRNQSYGAYQLRREYSRNVFLAVLIAIGVVPALSGLSLLKAPPLEEVSPRADPGEHVVEFVLPERKPEAPQASSITPPSKPAPGNELRNPVVKTDTEDPAEAPDQPGILTNNPDAEPGNAGSIPGEGTPGSSLPDSGEGEKTLSVSEIDVFPEFPGGEGALRSFLSASLRYPAEAREMGVGGNVYISFVVDKSGQVRDVQLLKGIGYGCDAEALRVIALMPPWKPGMNKGKVVSVRFSIPIRFSLR